MQLRSRFGRVPRPVLPTNTHALAFELGASLPIGGKHCRGCGRVINALFVQQNRGPSGILHSDLPPIKHDEIACEAVHTTSLPNVGKFPETGDRHQFYMARDNAPLPHHEAWWRRYRDFVITSELPPPSARRCVP